ncbi:MAG: aspartate--tRNA ligase [Candidatus Berkelbacteria bacterium]|nr:aspartate--tRNA ligase [Candidatus Berkelbacteria bacterium]
MKRILIKETVAKVGEEVLISGWVNTRRDHGKIVFMDIRDMSGLIQVVFVPGSKAYEKISDVRPEWVISISGKINSRPEKMINKDLVTGTIEMEAVDIEILNSAKTPPFEVDKDTSHVDEELRLKYRYLDLRSERMTHNIRLRDNVITFLRDYMHRNDFVEIETPILMKGTPEGAREYIVPSRIYPGKFYVLPQSPQQYKQLCMVAGFERYFQMARCFRDEDQRGDRQPEFTQFDFEMSFVTQEDILSFTEKMFIEMVEKMFPGKKLAVKPFPRLKYDEAIEKYGSDKPDLRKNKNDPNELAFCWILDFPMFEKDKDGNITSKHHPFCSIKEEDKEKFMKGQDLMNIRANAYDLVLNGYELSSGSIRIHEYELQKRIFDLLNISEDEQQKRFGHMLEAFTYGAPPHGGIAPGIDRIVMLLAEEPNIREIIAFPKTGDARDPMTNAPATVSAQQLKDVHIELADDAKGKALDRAETQTNE